MVKRKRTNNYLQNTTQKTKDRATRTPLNPGKNSGAPEGIAVSAPLVAHVVLLVTICFQDHKSIICV